MLKTAHNIIESWERHLNKPLNILRMYSKRDTDILGNRNCVLDTRSAGFKKFTKDHRESIRQSTKRLLMSATQI